MAAADRDYVSLTCRGGPGRSSPGRWSRRCRCFSVDVGAKVLGASCSSSWRSLVVTASRCCAGGGPDGLDLGGVLRAGQCPRRRLRRVCGHRAGVRVRVVHRLRGDGDLRRGAQGPEEDRASRHLPGRHRHHRPLRPHVLGGGERVGILDVVDRVVEISHRRGRTAGRPGRGDLRGGHRVRRRLVGDADELAGGEQPVRGAARLSELRGTLPVRDGTGRGAALRAGPRQPRRRPCGRVGRHRGPRRAWSSCCSRSVGSTRC